MERIMEWNQKQMEMDSPDGIRFAMWVQEVRRGDAFLSYAPNTITIKNNTSQFE